jgi:methylenetetrahydrofolate reductase (NADPH)
MAPAARRASARTKPVARLKKETGVDAAAHLTCVGATQGEIDEIARAYWDAGIRHIVALRGDPPGGMGGKYSPHPGGYANAAELIAGLKKIGPFQISAACYPEKHPDSADAKADLENLKRKVDAGADRCITQFFFEADDFLRFRDSAAAAGVIAPIVPGIMPVSNFQGITKMAGLCGAKVPAWLAHLFDGLDDDVETRRMIAATVAGDLCRRLRDEGVDPVPLLHAEPRRSHFRDLPFAGSTSTMTRAEKAELLREIGSERILVKDGLMAR